MKIPSLPIPVIQEIDNQTALHRVQLINEAVKFFAAGDPLVWRAGDPLPPTRYASTSVKEDPATRKYRGEVAAGYDAKRENSDKWINEQAIIEDMLSVLPEGTAILDCPVGTGRFIEYYKQKGFYVTGVDINKEMMVQAEQKAGGDHRITFLLGDVRDLPLHDKAYDVSLMVRLSRWLSPEDFKLALQELQRVTKDKIIFTARVRNHPHARGYDLINDALDGWRIVQDDRADGDDYRVIELEAFE